MTFIVYLHIYLKNQADLIDHAVWGLGMWPFAFWVCGFESCRRPVTFLFLVCFLLLQVEVSATGRSLVQGSPTEYDVLLCVT
jgi:hypothetical protein